MSDRPRTVWIGTDNVFTLEQFKNEKTGQIITGVNTAALNIFSGVDDSLLATLPLSETFVGSGDYEALVSDKQAGLSEGMPLRLRFDLDAGPGLHLRIDAKAVARVKKDDGL